MVLKKKEKPSQGYLKSVPWFLKPVSGAWLCLGTENIKTHKTGSLSSDNVNIIWGGPRGRPLQHSVVHLGTEASSWEKECFFWREGGGGNNDGQRWCRTCPVWALFMALHMYYQINLHSHPVRLELALSPGRRKWQPTPVFLPGESQGQRSLVGCHLWGHTDPDMTEVT